ncbi:MAG: VCBS repeat-containing protein, partial [Akkermansiaceae bacterium]|nr:VCBS repeat-containing protein [Akkermansiaceae bacterium]
MSLDVADFNADGAPDLAITSNGTLIVVLNDGAGAFGEPVTPPRQPASNPIKLLGSADLDRDGDLDLVTRLSRPTGLQVEQNDGIGGFRMTTDVGIDSPAAAMTVADFDGDGWEDLALVSTSPEAMRVVWNDGGQDGATAGTGTLELEILELEGCADSRGCRPHGGTLIDLDGDGDLDAVGIVTHPSEFVILDNEDGFMMARTRPYRFGAAGQQNGEHGQWVAAGDLDGDGDTDLVSVDNHSNDFWVHINTGSGSLERVGPEKRVPVGAAPQHVTLGDLDGDGDLDGVVSNLGDGSISLVFGNGDGTFQPRSKTIVTGSGTRGTVIVDLTGDNNADIVSANSSASSLTVLVNGGNGSFPGRGRAVRLAGNPSGVTSADLDHDGDLDLVAAIGDRRTCAILLNEGDGSFAAPHYIPVDQSG